MPGTVFNYSSQRERTLFDGALKATLLALTTADNGDVVIVQTVYSGVNEHKRVRRDTDATL